MIKQQRRVEITTDADQTRNLAQAIAGCLEPGDLITLQGELGAGKTTFVQGLVRGLDVPQEATSPTFVLIVEYAGRLPILHLDAYRLTNRSGEPVCYDALRDAGVLDLLERDDAVKIVEWPERIADALPAARFAISITPGEADNERRIEVIERIEAAA